jgi:hypothetical protein
MNQLIQMTVIWVERAFVFTSRARESKREGKHSFAVIRQAEACMHEFLTIFDER